MKYPVLAIAGLLALIELSAGLLVTLSIAAGLLLALVERTSKLDTQANSLTFRARLLGDGGSFPNDEPEMATAPTTPAIVLDGGSLEHHRG